MRIFMVLSDNTFPPDIRVEKEIHALKSAGHQIGIISLRFGNEPEHEVIDGVEIWRMHIPFRKVRYVGRMLELALFRHLTKGRILQAARKFNPDAIHVHDLPLALPALKVAKKLGVPLVADMHEHYVGLLQDRGVTGITGTIMARVLYSEEKRVFENATAVITVVEENKIRIERQFGVKGKVYVVSNTADTSILDPLKKEFSGLERKWDMCYVGGISPERGLDTVMQALLKVPGKLNVSIVGGGDYCTLKETVSGSDHEVVFTGPLPFKDAMRYVMSSKFALIPHKRTLLTENTVPHKLFQYMYLGTPPIVSDVSPLATVVRRENCGLVFRADDPDDCAATIKKAMKLYDDEADEWDRMSSAGEEAVRKTYNWSKESKKLIAIYDALGETE